MYLLDTNIILELLLDQDRAAEVERFLRTTPPGRLYFSEFSLYSLGIILFRHGRHDAFDQIVRDLFVTDRVRLLRLGTTEIQDTARTARQHNLDFDDAYQYAVAEMHRLAIVSFDGDFDRTDRGRMTPAEAMAE